MGVVNVTPDSFSDGGLYLDPGAAIAHGRELAAQGADILDVGGESTRPGAAAVAVEEELRRVEPVVAGLAGLGVEISVDTSKAPVAEAALDAGATIVNDVTALRGDPEMAGLVADRGAGVVLMHMAGDPRTMQVNPEYGDVVAEVRDFLAARLAAAVGGRDRRVADLARPRDRLRQDRPSTTSNCCAASTGWPRSAARSWSAPRARASSAAPTAPRPTTASAARSPPRSSPPPRAPRSSASTTCARCHRR